MISYNFVRNEFDNCVYSRKLLDGSYIYLLLFVDDMLVTAKRAILILMLLKLC